MPAVPEYLRNTPEQEQYRVNGNNKAEIRHRLPRELEVALSVNEKVLHKGLEEVVNAVSSIWQLQKQTPFYARGLTEKDVRELGRKNPDIISPHTYVERRNGDIVAVPYKEKFTEQVATISAKIRQIARTIPIDDHGLMDESYTRLMVLADAFDTDNWENADRERFSSRSWDNKVEFVIGPFETNLDHFGIKTTQQGLVGVIDEQATRELDRIVNAASTYIEGKQPPIIELKVLFVTAATGIINPSTGEAWKAQVLPNDPKMVKEFGSRGLIYINLLEDHFNNILYPVMRRVFEPGLFQKFVKQDLFTAYRNWIALHEFWHPVGHEEGQEKRQGSLFLPFHELHCDIAALSIAKTLIGRVLDSDEFEAILMVQLARALNDIYSYHFSDKKFPDPYADGSGALLDYLAEFAGLRPLREDGRLGLYQEKQVIAAVNNLVGKFNIDAKGADFEETKRFFDEFKSGKGHKFAESLLRDLFEEPQPVLGT